MLASSVERSKPTPYPSKARSALVRRTILVVLVLAALALVTVSFRSPTAGALHDLQGAGASALRPFQIAATRVAAPFRDAYDYLDSLARAKAQNAELKRVNAELRRDVLISAARAAKYPELLRLLHFEQGPSFPHGYRVVNASVITFPAGPFAHRLTIDAGSSSGIRVDSPVVSGDGLVGLVTDVSPETATVMLLTDPQSAVAARDLRHGVRGVIQVGPGGTLVLNDVPKQQVVQAGDVIVTDGTRNPRYPDLYPYGIPIGRVAAVGATDTATFLQVQVQPFVSFGSLDAVGVLVPKHRR